MLPIDWKRAVRKLLLVFCCVAAPAAADPIALVFNDDNTPSGCDDGCAAAAARALIASPGHFLVKYVGPKGEPLTRELLRSASIYVQPGGGDDLNATSAHRKD